MEAVSRELVMLRTQDGKVPFEEWLNSLKSKALESAVLARLSRIEDGNFGDHNSVGDGVLSLKVQDYGFIMALMAKQLWF